MSPAGHVPQPPLHGPGTENKAKTTRRIMHYDDSSRRSPLRHQCDELLRAISLKSDRFGVQQAVRIIVDRALLLCVEASASRPSPPYIQNEWLAAGLQAYVQANDFVWGVFGKFPL